MDARHRPVLGTPREWAVRLTAGVLVGVFLGVIGPFGTYGQPLASRVAQWALGALLGAAVFTLAVRFARWRAPRLDVPLWFATGAAVGVAAVPYSAALGLLFSPRYWLHGGWPAWLELYGDCLLIAAPVTVAALVLPRRGEPLPAPVAGSPAAIEAPAAGADARHGGLLARLPARLGRQLVALQMEDHYVRAHTRRGSDLLLMPMGQAIAELPPVEGLRVHRSWWVARGAVEAPVWSGRNLRLRLAGGLEAPVARAQVATLRAAGWFAGEDEAQRPGSTS